MWTFQLYVKGEVYGRRSGQAILAAQPGTLHTGFLPGDYTAAIA